LSSYELSSSFGELSVFLAFIITREEAEVYLGEIHYIICISTAYLHKAFHTQIISDLKKTPAVIMEIDSNPLRTGAICIFNWIQCYISGDYSIKVGTNIRSKVGTFPLDFGKQ